VDLQVVLVGLVVSEALLLLWGMLEVGAAWVLAAAT
jgi:hypothetical protein